MQPELLAPAGGPAALKAAVEAGADSVYMGSAWDARRRARNFTREELASALAYCRREKVRAYVALNTLIFEGELRAVAEYISFVYEHGADALIVQDLGVAAMAREIAPDLPLHASTQLSVHNSRTASLLKGLGFTRVILARELSLEQAKTIRGNAGVEVECFVHGALCYSYSGKCLWSFVQTGRSGNRGVCAQLCRFPWKLECGGKLVDAGYLTSAKDLNAIKGLPGIARAGIDCVKIEGRLKGAEYVRAVVGAYRRAIDSGEAVDLSSFTGRGYTEGYLFGEARGGKLTNPRGPSFAGEKVGEVVSVSGQGARVKLLAPLRPGDAIRTSRSGTVIELYRVYAGGREVREARGECTLMIKTLRRGDAVFKVERSSVEDGFLAAIKARKTRSAQPLSLPSGTLGLERMPLVFLEHAGEVWDAPAGSACVVPFEEAGDKALEAARRRGVRLVVDTPRIVFDEQLPAVGKRVDGLSERGVPLFMVSEPSLVSKHACIAGPYANVANSLAARAWKGFGNVRGIVSSIELPADAAEKLGFMAFAGGRIELAISENDVFREWGMARREDCFLVDPRGNRFPVRVKNGRTVILSPSR